MNQDNCIWPLRTTCSMGRAAARLGQPEERGLPVTCSGLVCSGPAMGEACCCGPVGWWVSRPVVFQGGPRPSLQLGCRSWAGAPWPRTHPAGLTGVLIGLSDPLKKKKKHPWGEELRELETQVTRQLLLVLSGPAGCELCLVRRGFA